jgi:hypothetical protein
MVYIVSRVKTGYLAVPLDRHCAVLKIFGPKIGLICQSTGVGKSTPAVVFEKLLTAPFSSQNK